MAAYLRHGDRVRERVIGDLDGLVTLGAQWREGLVVGAGSGLIAIVWSDLPDVRSFPFRSGEQRDSIEVVPPDPRHGRRS